MPYYQITRADMLGARVIVHPGRLAESAEDAIAGTLRLVGVTLEANVLPFNPHVYSSDMLATWREELFDELDIHPQDAEDECLGHFYKASRRDMASPRACNPVQPSCDAEQLMALHEFSTLVDELLTARLDHEQDEENKALHAANDRGTA